MDKNHSIIKIEERKKGQHLRAEERGWRLVSREVRNLGAPKNELGYV
jgi:hypothetical protein